MRHGPVSLVNKELLEKAGKVLQKLTATAERAFVTLRVCLLWTPNAGDRMASMLVLVLATAAGEALRIEPAIAGAQRGVYSNIDLTRIRLWRTTLQWPG